MKKIIAIFITFILFSSCRHGCPTRVDNLEIFPVVSYDTGEPVSGMPDWYHSEFQNELLHFSLEFDHYGGGNYCDYYWENYPLMDTYELSCDVEIIAGRETIPANQLLNDYFTIEKFENENTWIVFLISEKASSNMQFNDEYYTFTARIKTENDDEYMQDDCLVKFN